MTYAYKYLLLRTFAIPTGEDPDKIASAEYDEQFGNDKITEREFNNLVSLVEKHGKTRDWLFEATGKTRGSDISKAEYTRIVKQFDDNR